MDAMTQVGDGVHLVHGTDVGWVLVQDGDALTVVDTGYPGDADRLDASVRALGRGPGDVAAVLVTHWHVDHVGSVVRWSGRHGVPVLVHPDERANATGERYESATPLDVARRAWRPRTALWATRITRAGATAHPTLPDVGTWDGDGPLDLPGGPVPVHTPGHTSGHAVYLFPAAGWSPRPPRRRGRRRPHPPTPMPAERDVRGPFSADRARRRHAQRGMTRGRPRGADALSFVLRVRTSRRRPSRRPWRPR